MSKNLKRRLTCLIVIIFMAGMWNWCSVSQAAEQEFVPGIILVPKFSMEAGFYTDAFRLELTTSVEGAQIIYTVDCSDPDPTNNTDATKIYSEPINISSKALNYAFSDDYFTGTVIKAAVYLPSTGKLSDVITKTYFVDEDMTTRYQLPVISITTDGKNLYDQQIGLWANEANLKAKGDEWERPAYFEFFTKDGKLELSMNIGIRLHGNSTRLWSEIKALRLYARKEYDTQNKFEYDFFSNSVLPAYEKNGDGTAVISFKRLVLRNGASDSHHPRSVFFRDAFTQSLVAELNLDSQAYQPVALFVNGSFYMISNLRERLDENYIASHYNIDEEDFEIIDLLMNNQSKTLTAAAYHREASAADYYNDMITYLHNNDITQAEVYQKVETWMDLDNYIDYMILQIFSGNDDFPGMNNTRLWRYTGTEESDEYGLDGKLRWMVFDLDFAFGLNTWQKNVTYGYDAYKNTLAMNLDANSSAHPNYPYATFLFRTMMENDTFREKFCLRYSDLMNTVFDKSFMEERYKEVKSYYEPGIDEVFQRFNLDGINWNSNTELLEQFVSVRTGYCRTQLVDYFKLGEQYQLSISVSDQKGNANHGQVTVNSITVDENARNRSDGYWLGTYYQNLPTIVTAVPEDGYSFLGWYQGTELVSEDATYVIDNNSDLIALIPAFSNTGKFDITAYDINKKAGTSLVSDSESNDDRQDIIIIAIVLFLAAGGIVILCLKKKRKSK